MKIDFTSQYGPWAIIAGASEGTGRCFAKALAARGVHSILVARRQAPLDALAEEIHAAGGAECITASIDLSADDACEQIKTTAGDREIGLYISNAGADPNGSRFLDKPIDTWLGMVSRNLNTTLRCCHHFGGLMKARGRGGLLLVSSGAGWGGASHMATYSALKACDMRLAESLWAELSDYGVDVLCLVLGTTDTPAFRELLEEKGKKPPRSMASPEKVAETGLANLGRGPVYNFGQLVGLRAGWTRQRTKLISKFSQKLVFGADD